MDQSVLVAKGDGNRELVGERADGDAVGTAVVPALAGVGDANRIGAPCTIGALTTPGEGRYCVGDIEPARGAVVPMEVDPTLRVGLAVEICILSVCPAMTKGVAVKLPPFPLTSPLHTAGGVADGAEAHIPVSIGMRGIRSPPVISTAGTCREAADC